MKLIILCFFFLTIGVEAKKIGKNQKVINVEQQKKLNAVAKKWNIDISTKKGKKAFRKKLLERKLAFKNLSMSEKRKILTKRIESMKRRLKKQGLADKEIAKRISARKKKIAQTLRKFQRLKK